MTPRTSQDLTALDPWEDLRTAFTPDRTVHHRRGAPVMVRYGLHLLVVPEAPRAWRARHRRVLHRMGFRPDDQIGGATDWEWRPPPALVEAVLAQADATGSSTGRFGPSERGRRWGTVDRLVRARALIVARDVFAWAPRDLCVHPLPAEPEDELGRLP